MRTLPDALGVLDDDALADFGRGKRPIAHLADALRARPWLLAHVCDASDDEIALLAETNASVAYCPRSSSYFAHHAELGPHRYRDMLAAGVNVCLGTDSIVNLPPAERGAPTLGVLDEMRFLSQRDHTDPRTLLAMGTVKAALLGGGDFVVLVDPAAHWHDASFLTAARSLATPSVTSLDLPASAFLEALPAPALAFLMTRNETEGRRC